MSEYFIIRLSRQDIEQIMYFLPEGNPVKDVINGRIAMWAMEGKWE